MNQHDSLQIFTDSLDNNSRMGHTMVLSSAVAGDAIRVQEHRPHTLSMVVEVRRNGLPVSADTIGAHTLRCNESGAMLSYRTKGLGKGGKGGKGGQRACGCGGPTRRRACWSPCGSTCSPCGSTCSPCGW